MQRIAILFLASFISVNAFSAYLRNVPVELRQPDGSLIHCFITGDEFHRRVHDKNNFTIIQNPETGYYVYALKKGKQLVPSENVVGKNDPKLMQLEPILDILPQKMEGKRITLLKSAKETTTNSTKGNFNNIVIFIRFSDQEPTTLTLKDYEDKFNSTTVVSLKSYFKEVSSSQLIVTTGFYPQPENQTIIEYQDSHSRDYYVEYNSTTNPIGYKTEEWEAREKNLVKNAIESVKDQINASQANYDLNNDGFIDNLIFIIQGNADGWGHILWPMSMTMNDSKIFIGNKQVNQYNKQLSTWIDVGVICHEFFHSLGAPDLYRYLNLVTDPVGSWDIMGSSNSQHMTTFMKWKYGKWFDTIPEIIQPGTYTLLPVSKSPNACYKIPSPDNPSEYFIVEYRKKEGLLESALPANYDEGLIIYRINTQVQWGNTGGPPDEIYIFRMDGTSFQNGDISKAAFSSNTGRTSFNSNTNPSCFLSSGKKGWIDISNITAADNQISFTVNTSEALYGPRNLTASKQDNQVLLKWNSPVKKNSMLLGYNVYQAGSATPLNTSIITDTTYQTSVPGNNDTYGYLVTAKYQQGESDPDLCNFINHESASVKDSLTLIAIYNQCNGPNWTRKTNWLTGSLNTWEGVTVENGRVVKLSLGDEGPSIGLIGELPFELILNLTEIRWLSFWQNQLTGTIPESWSALEKLQVLSLSMNQFTGELPSSWSKLVKLQRLEVLGNQITGTLPASWSSLVNLEHLWLNDNQLSGTLPASWSSLVQLQDLWLSHNKLTGSVPKSWSALINLRNFNLFNNQLTGDLNEDWSSFTSIWQLPISDNQFTGTLPESWSAFVNLRFLSLKNNNITGPVPENWSSLVNLEFLYFGNNHITSLPPMPTWTKLQFLDASNNLLDFGDIEPYIYLGNNFFYAPQGLVGEPDTLIKKLEDEFRITFDVGGKNNKYQWYKNDGQISGATSSEYYIPLLASKDAGSYTCQITNTVATQLTLTSHPIILILNQPPVANAGTNQTVNEGATVTMGGLASSDPDGNILTYKWTAPAGIEMSSTITRNTTFIAPEVKQDSILTFSLIVNDGYVNSEPSEVTITIKNVIKTSSEILGIEGFKIYPNPTTGVIKLELAQNSGKKAEISVSNLIGTEVFRMEFIDSANYQIDLSNQVSGIYLLKVNIDNQQYISKIVIRKD